MRLFQGIFHESCSKARFLISSRRIFPPRRSTRSSRSPEFHEALRPIGSKPKGYLSATKPVCRGKYLRSAWPNYAGQKNTMNLKRGPANCTTQTFTRVQRNTKIPSSSFVFAGYKERKRGRRGGGGREEGRGVERGEHNNRPRQERRTLPSPSLIAITGRSRGDRKVLTGNGIPADRINRTC